MDASVFLQLIKDNGQAIQVSEANSKFKFGTYGFYVEKETKSDDSLTIRSVRIMYVPANAKNRPLPGDIVAFGKSKTRILSVTEIGTQGKAIVLKLEVQ